MTAFSTLDEGWRLTHLGRLMGHALRRFDARVLQLMARNVEVPLALSNLAARDQVSAAHVHITRHLALGGDRLTDLAQRAGMTKQAMADLVDQCAAWGLVERRPDPHDARARRVCFTPTGLPGCRRFATRWRRPRPSSAPRWETMWRWWCQWAWRPTPAAICRRVDRSAAFVFPLPPLPCR